MKTGTPPPSKQRALSGSEQEGQATGARGSPGPGRFLRAGQRARQGDTGAGRASGAATGERAAARVSFPFRFVSSGGRARQGGSA